MDGDLERRSMRQPPLPGAQPAPLWPKRRRCSCATTRPTARRRVLDELRASDFARLDAGGHVYLDYTGAGLYADSQLREHFELLQQNVFGNPHSANPTSATMTALVEQARAAVLAFFRASPDEYVAIFTPNATGALRLVGEAYPFRAGDRFLLTFDNHNSVNGIREFARARGAETTYVPSEPLRPARRRAAAGALPDRGRRRSPQPLRLPGAVELLRRPASARMDRARARARLGRAPRRRRVRPHEPARPRPLAPRLRRAVVLQDVRLADRRRLPARPPRRAREARTALVLRRHDRRRVRPARLAPVGPGRGPLRGRHRQLPQPARGRDRAPPARPDRPRDDPHPRRGARLVAARRRSARSATPTAPRPPRSTARAARIAAAPRSPSTSSTPTAASSTSATSTASPAPTRSRCGPAASATPAPARSPSRSRARHSSAASSATA